MTGHDVADQLRGSLRRHPERTAVVVGREQLSYRELELATDRLAARLRELGVRPGQTVLLHLRQSADTLVGMVAALRAGAAWCVTEPGHPAERLAALTRDLECGAVVWDGAADSDVREAVARLADEAPAPLAVLDLAELGRSVPQGAATGPGPWTEVPPGAPAYAITTSGSTGAPKAVVVGRDNLSAMVAARGDEPGGIRFSACRFAWDGALMLTFGALCTGGTAVLPDHAALRDARASAELVLLRQATQVVCPPSYYRLMLPHLAGAGAHLREVVVAGEVVPPALVAQHRAALPTTRLRNEYGPTETTVSVLGHTLRDDSPRTVPVGRVSGATSVHVLDERLEPCPPGTVGELYVGGPQVTRGYARRPARTADSFVADPFSSRPGARMYRTGDLVLVGEDGEIEFRGRADGQIKVRGIRVERHGVQAVLETHPAVRQAGVLGVPGDDGALRLVAFWTPAEDAVALPGPRELIAHCRTSLVADAVPEEYITLGSMPLAPSGKVDEAALLALLTPRSGGGSASGPGGDEREALSREVAKMWARVLRHEDFGPEDSFFDAGGNSRSVVELHLCLETRWPGALRVGQLFDLDRVPEQADALLAAGARPTPQ
ncbi:non-ribosomal peptide synthetase [Streptomyces sp. NPDC014872]|uniref:non-ribosomal peptide synthetase n=1 Tax=Streptomyces sp. NPDC014872 TaxID=3364926 RepID=UPI0036FC0428